MTQMDLTSKMFCCFFDQWDQDEAQECVAYMVLMDDAFHFLN